MSTPLPLLLLLLLLLLLRCGSAAAGKGVLSDVLAPEMVDAPALLGTVRPCPRSLRCWCPEGFEGTRFFEGSDIGAALAGQPRGLVLDVGAFDGSNAITYARAGHEVHAFEPSPSKRRPIEAAFAASGLAANLTLHAVALSDVRGTLDFYVTPAVGGRPARSAATGEGVDGPQGSEQDQLDKPPWPSTRVAVAVETLDHVLGDREVLYAKIDAQGHDHAVLRGARRLLQSHRIRRVAFELSPALSAGSEARYVEAVRWLTLIGYRCYDCGRLLPISADTQVEALVSALLHVKRGIKFKGADIKLWTDLLCLAPRPASSPPAE